MIESKAVACLGHRMCRLERRLRNIFFLAFTVRALDQATLRTAETKGAKLSEKAGLQVSATE